MLCFTHHTFKNCFLGKLHVFYKMDKTLKQFLFYFSICQKKAVLSLSSPNIQVMVCRQSLASKV